MSLMRNAVVFVAVMVVVVIAYPATWMAVSGALIEGRQFSTFGWLSWPHVISVLVSGFVFLVAGVVLAGLLSSPRAWIWAVALGLAYGTFRLYFSSQPFPWSAEREVLFWVSMELVVPPLAAALGAYGFVRLFAAKRVTAKRS